jgi:MFS family permease
LHETFRALRSRNYRLFYVGQSLSLIGTWMQSLAMSWLVYRLTGSATILGAVTFAQQIPMFLVSPLAGVFADRVDRRRLLIGTQSLQAVQALALGALTLLGLVRVWEIVVLSVFVGIVNAFDTPGRQSFVIEMVDRREDLPNAIALNSTQFNLARLIGPAIAGLTVQAVGEGVCFAINAASFLAVIVSLLLIRVQAKEANADSQQAWRQFVEGARYTWTSGPIRSLLLLLALMSLVSGSYQVLLPVYARSIFHGRAGLLGGLYSFIAMGALVAAITLASRKSVVGLGAWIVRSAALFAVALAVLASTRQPWQAFAVLPFVGFGAMMHMGSTNTLIQTVVDDRMRGRVMAFYAMSFIGTTPIGSLLAGSSSDLFGPQRTLIVAGTLGVIGAFLFLRNLPAFRRQVRPIYEARGLI